MEKESRIELIKLYESLEKGSLAKLLIEKIGESERQIEKLKCEISTNTN